MKIKTIHAHFHQSLGNCNSERIGFTVEVEEDDNLEKIVEQLRNRASEIIGEECTRFYRKLRVSRRELESIEQQLSQRKEEYNNLAEFFRTQGIKDLPALSGTVNLLPPALINDVHHEIVGEIEEEDEEDWEEEDFE